ncbi:MAG: CBS domain-containing protein, partial [Spirochaetia bacterium]
VGLARALAVDPDILLMDEAFSALDPLIRSDMQDELIALEHEVKKTILFITHDLDEALKMGDRIVLMKDGAIVQIGTPEEILTAPANHYVERFIENVDKTKVLTAKDVMYKPREVAYVKDGPVTALHKMREMESNKIFVVDRDRRLKGIITADAAGEAVKANNHDLLELVEEYELQIVKPETPVKELFGYIVDNNYPLAVVDENKKLKGAIVKGSILSALAERREINE